MNLDSSQASANGSYTGCNTPSPRACLPNGGCSERPCGYSSGDILFPLGGFPSLRLPVVVVLTPAYLFEQN